MLVYIQIESQPYIYIYIYMHVCQISDNGYYYNMHFLLEVKRRNFQKRGNKGLRTAEWILAGPSPCIVCGCCKED